MSKDDCRASRRGRGEHGGQTGRLARVATAGRGDFCDYAISPTATTASHRSRHDDSRPSVRSFVHPSISQLSLSVVEATAAAAAASETRATPRGRVV